jgi:hemerythrin-like metal-binding protein
MQWSEEYATGIERIDHQHRTLFGMVDDFRAALDAGQGERVYGEFLTFLDVYARSHFCIEEQCMERYRCPVAEENRAAHARLVDVLAGFLHQYVVGGWDPANAGRLLDTVEDWLTYHICRIDVQLGNSVEGAAPESP